VGDKGLEILARVLGHDVKTSGQSMTGGLVQNIQHSVLPEIKPVYTFILTLIAMSPILWKIWASPDPKKFAESAGLVTLSAFFFGWHVHEKAILTATLPLAFGLLDDDSLNKRKAFFLLNLAANASLLPLIHPPFETPIKVPIVIAHTLTTLALLENPTTPAAKKNKTKQNKSAPEPELFQPKNIPIVAGPLMALYALGFGIIQTFESVIQPVFLPRYHFLPLLLWSVYSTLGIAAAAAMYYVS